MLADVPLVLSHLSARTLIGSFDQWRISLRRQFYFIDYSRFRHMLKAHMYKFSYLLTYLPV